MERWRRVVPAGTAVVLAVALLGPALAPGFVLTYDMVWVPDLALRSDFFGLGSGLPRAVPSDALVAVLDEVVPGAWLQKLVLLGALVAGGLGVRRLVGTASVAAQVAAVVAYTWSPFVVERLLVGHWPLLVAHAVVPWLILSLRGWRTDSRRRAWWVLLPLAGLSPSGGLMAALVVVVVGAGRWPPRRWAELAAVAVAANAPWLVAGLLHVDVARSDPRAAVAFALSDEGLLPGPVAALGLGGLWNADAVPTSRTGPLAVLALVVVLGLVGMSLWGIRRGRGTEDVRRLALLWAVGYSVAVATWAAPGLSAGLAESVPGGGLLRDGSRALLLCSPLVAVLVGRGVAEVGRLLTIPWQRLVVVACLAAVPVVVMPDAVGGVSGRLSATTYPAAYDAARDAVGDQAGDVLVLPFSSYRAPDWNDARPVLDPLGRYLRPNYLVDDTLVVDGIPLSGEDPRAAAAAQALDGPDPEADLAALGVRFVVVDRTVAGDVPVVGGRQVLDGEVQVLELASAAHRDPPAWWVLLVGLAWAAYAALLIGGLGHAVTTARRRPWRTARQ